MKRILFALLFSVIGVVGAQAACPATFAQMKDNASATFNMGLLSDPNGNCQSYVVPTQAGAVLSATNGWYTNILQGNAVLSAANPLVMSPGTGATWTVTGNVSNASSAVATGSTNVGNISYNYGFNGATWDQLQVDGSKNLKVNVTNSNANGLAAMASSSPVVIASDQKASTQNASAAINISTATTTQLVAISGSTKVYVTAWDVIAGGTGNITLEYGTGTACATGTTVLTGAYNLTAQAGISKGDGSAPVLIVPAGNALCALTSAAVQMSGSVTYQQF